MFSVAAMSEDQLATLGPEPKGPPTKKLVSPMWPSTYSRIETPVILWKVYAHRSRL